MAELAGLEAKWAALSPGTKVGIGVGVLGIAATVYFARGKIASVGSGGGSVPVDGSAGAADSFGLGIPGTPPSGTPGGTGTGTGGSGTGGSASGSAGGSSGGGSKGGGGGSKPPKPPTKKPPTKKPPTQPKPKPKPKGHGATHAHLAHTATQTRAGAGHPAIQYGVGEKRYNELTDRQQSAKPQQSSGQGSGQGSGQDIDFSHKVLA